jgi:hypothetical protein
MKLPKLFIETLGNKARAIVKVLLERPEGITSVDAGRRQPANLSLSFYACRGKNDNRIIAQG